MLLRVSERSDIEEEGASRRVRVRLPPWLGGNDILQPVGEAELKATPVDASTFWWQLEAACATALSLFVSTSGEGPPIAGAHTAAATTWWVAQMNKLLSEVSDFSNYCNADGTFVPRRLFETFMSVEQAGCRLQGILAHDRDLTTRRALGFDAFDTMKGLGIIDLFEACKLRLAERTLASLENELPSQAGELLLLPARRAVQALRDLRPRRSA